jgi:predicted dithiol-disulfide oxidoreductase (DUF899 family)
VAYLTVLIFQWIVGVSDYMVDCHDQSIAGEEAQTDVPQAVSAAEWQAASEALLAKEKEATGARDALAAERRGLRMVEIDKQYVFEGPVGFALVSRAPIEQIESYRQRMGWTIPSFSSAGT